jgi:RimJ/RimL family protein N-acetyltransferase
MNVPTLTTARLVLRLHDRADFPDCAKLWADPIVTRHIGGRPFTEEEVWSRLLRYVGHWWVMGFGYWIVREASTERLVGEVGLSDFKRAIVPALAGPEMGWVLMPEMHGQGFATEAVRAVTGWADEHLDATKTTCIIDPENLASIRVAQKAGYVQTGSQDYKGSNVQVYARPRA